MRRFRPIVIVLGLACVGAGCTPSNDTATSRSAAALNSVSRVVAPASGVYLRPPTWPCDKTDPTPSLRPTGPLPLPGQMPAGTFMRTIQDRNKLIVGVDQNTLGFGYRSGGQIAGFDVDLLREVARAIFGDENKIEFRSVTTTQRVPELQSGDVDIVASLLSITCDRWRQIDFTSQYYKAEQRVMVRANSSIHSLRDLGGKKVCATGGSTSLDTLNQIIKATGLKATVYPVVLRTDCLVALQEGEADAITSDDTVLEGFHVQDPFGTQFIPGTIEPERYGMGIRVAHPEFVRFVNAVLEELRANGRYEQLYTQDLTASLGIPYVPPPPPKYRS